MGIKTGPREIVRMGREERSARDVASKLTITITDKKDSH